MRGLSPLLSFVAKRQVLALFAVGDVYASLCKKRRLPAADLSQPCAPPVSLSLVTRSPGVGSQPCGASAIKCWWLPRNPLVC